MQNSEKMVIKELRETFALCTTIAEARTEKYGSIHEVFDKHDLFAYAQLKLKRAAATRPDSNIDDILDTINYLAYYAVSATEGKISKGEVVGDEAKIVSIFKNND